MLCHNSNQSSTPSPYLSLLLHTSLQFSNGIEALLKLGMFIDLHDSVINLCFLASHESSYNPVVPPTRVILAAVRIILAR